MRRVGQRRSGSHRAVIMGLLAFAAGIAGLTRSASAQTILNGSFAANGNTTYQATGANISNWTVTNEGSPNPPACIIANNSFTGCSFPAVNPSNLGTDPAGSPYFGAATWSGTNVTIATAVPVSGLVVNKQYIISFYQAAIEDTTNVVDNAFWTVTFGSSHQNSPNMAFTSSQNFVAWDATPISMIFTATATSETLSFLATGGTNSGPPMALLDGVSIGNVPTPEPASLALLGVGAAGIVALRRARRGRNGPPAAAA
jgi:hypothetical protein